MTGIKNGWKKNAAMTLALALFLSSWTGFMEFELEEEFSNNETISNSNPIRNESASEIPYDVVVFDIDPWTQWNHHIDDWPIDDQEEIVYYIHIDESLLGSTIYSFLDVYDAWFSSDPDLDLYLFDPDGYQVAISANEGDVSEEVEFVADMIGDWEIVVVSYDGDGWFDLYRTVISNAAPVIDHWGINTETPFLNENFLINACGAFDPEGDELDYQWKKDGSVIYNPNGTSVGTCDMFDSLSDTQNHYFTVTVTDSFGASSSEGFHVRAVDPGWNDGDGDSSQYIDLGISGEFSFEQMTGIWKIPNVLSSDNLSIQIGMLHEIQVESEGGVTSTFSLDAPPEHGGGLLNPHQLIVESEIGGVDYEVGYKPSLIVNVWLDGEFHNLALPMPSTNAMYDGQSSFSLAGYPLLYYWDDFAPLEVDYEEGWLNYSIEQTFTLAEYDLYPIIEWMVDNLASSLGQAWVDGATDILEWFIEIEVPLSFQVTVWSEGFQVVKANTQCTCDLGDFSGTLIQPWDRFSEFSTITNTFGIVEVTPLDGYSISSVLTSLSYVGVEVSPNIVLGFELNGESLWEESIYEFNVQFSQGSASWSSDDSTEFVWEWDEDLDGVPNHSDAFPQDSSETTDTDGDGVGDNADAFPNDPSEDSDSDLDGVGDNADAFPQDSSETTDTDGDGVGDNADAFPQDSSETTDTDGDGVGDNADAFWLDRSEWSDSDSDGVGDNADAFPNDPSEDSDSDLDGVGDNADAFPNDPSEDSDSDLDGFGDGIDQFPDDRMEWSDSDSDGVGDNADAFPNDPSEDSDSDLDGVGDNADAFPFDATETADSDGDGVGDNADAFPDDPGKVSAGSSEGDSENSGLPGFGALASLASLIIVAIRFRKLD